MVEQVHIVIPGDDPVQIADSSHLERLAPWGQVEVYRTRPASAQEKLDRCRDATVILNSRSTLTWRADDFAQLLKLKMIATCSVGTDSIDLDAAKARGIIVSNQPGVNAPFVAEHMFGLMFAGAKQAASQTAALKAGHWQKPTNMMIQGKQLGLVGTGAVGTAMARLGRALGMDVAAWTFNPSPERAVALGVRFLPLEELLATSDVVSLHVRLSDDSRGLIGAAELARMKKGAILLNGARGEVVDNPSLYHRAECLTHVGDSQAVRSLTQCGEPMRFAMAAPIDLRNDFDSVSLRRLAKRTRDATQSRRLLALAEVYDGGSRTDASRIGGVGLQIIRDWVLRFNARGPDGLVDGKSPGAPSKLNADHRRALAEVVEAGPVPAVDGVVRWRRKDLARWLLETFAISLDETTVGRELKALGFAKISARPRHYAQNELAVEAFKKNFPAELAKIRARLPKGVEIELWWQDEARIGQKNKLTRRWARRGTRPRAPRDQRTEWAYIFGAICPAKGKGAGLVMPWCDTDAMAAHLIEISAAVDPGAHAVLIVDQAGWHLTPKLAIPDNITVLALPPRSPELNPVENVWQFMRDNWLSNRIFKSYEDIVALCCQAWNNLIDQPWKIMSLGMRKWAHGF